MADFIAKPKDVIRVSLGFKYINKQTNNPIDGLEMFDVLLDPNDDRMKAIQFAEFALDDLIGPTAKPGSLTRSLKGLTTLIQDLKIVEKR